MQSTGDGTSLSNGSLLDGKELGENRDIGPAQSKCEYAAELAGECSGLNDDDAECLCIPRWNPERAGPTWQRRIQSASSYEEPSPSSEIAGCPNAGDRMI